MCGIYAIKNKKTGQLYVGQSVDIQYRHNTHTRQLRNGSHYNLHLQRSWSLHGPDVFELVVLEQCKETDLPLKEQTWLDSFDRKNLFNQVFDVQFRRGESNPFFGKTHTEEAKAAMSKAKKASYKGHGNPNFGKQHAADVKKRMSLGRSSKLDEQRVLAIAESLRNGEAHQDIADRFDVGRTTVTRISTGDRWSNITGGPISPVVYQNDGTRILSTNQRLRIGKGRLGKKHSEETKKLMRNQALVRYNKV